MFLKFRSLLNKTISKSYSQTYRRGTENDIVYEAMTCQVEESSETQLRRELIENDVVANKDFVLRSKLKKLKYPFKKENIQVFFSEC